MKKKILSLVIALSMAFCSAAALPENAFAELTGITVSAVDTATSGKCGENISWSLDGKGVLTISGSGKMTSYDWGESPFCNRNDIKSVVIKSGVTSIGSCAFMDCSLESLTIPSSVTSILDNAFLNCKSLKSTTISNGVKSIGLRAFDGCSSLTGITIPSSVTSIGDGAFRRCSSLTSVTIPSSVTSIGNSAFSGCSSLTSITIPKSVTSIGSYAFEYCKNLTSITIPSSVTSIGERAFEGTKWLEDQQKKNPLVVVNGILIDGKKCSGKVTIPSSVTSIGDGAFEDCTSLTSVTIPSSVTSIGDDAFYACDSLKSITIPSSVTSIGNSAFSGCSSLTSITIPSSVTSIGYGAFGYCENLTSITIPKSVTSIGSYAFEYCKNLTSITIPSSVKSIEEYAFYDCDSLTSITIPSSVTSIGDSAFYNCKSLKSVTIPSSVTSIGGWAFGYNSDRSKITKIDGFTVYVTSGSVAEKYANENGFKFVTRLSGSTRFETATKIADNVKSVNGTTETVVLVNSEKFADALAGVPYSFIKSAPILLAPNPKDSQHDTKFKSTLDEIKKLGAKNVIILGGNSSVSKEKAEDVLVKQGYTVTRIKGSTRYETATNIAEKVNSAPTEVFIVYSQKFPDALAISSIAAQKEAPILYVDKKGTIDANTKAYLTKHKATIKKAYVIGGTGAVSDDVKSQIDKTLGITSTRIKGSTRYETCLAVLNYSEFKSFVNTQAICVTTGEKFPDALAGGVLAAMVKMPLFLVNGSAKTLTLTDGQKSYLKAKTASVITVFGGKSTVPDSHIKTISGVLF